ncbi:MAG TPA: hypothetical protein PLS10_07180 [Chitinophagales bacterium]|nr:hypothetical protein [Chitinophagales bacterium]
MAKEDIESVKADLASAKAEITEKDSIITELSDSVKALEAENAELKIKAAGAPAVAPNIIEHNGEFYKTTAGSYNKEGDIVVLNKDLLKAKQDIFGKDKVRIASADDIAELIAEESNLIEKIQK